MFKILLCLFLPFCGHALTLQEAIDQAKLSSPVIQKSKSATIESEWKKKETFSGFLPTVSANALYLLDKRYALTNIKMSPSAPEAIVPQIIPSSQLALSSSLPLFEGFSNINKYRSASENNQAFINELSWNEFKIEMDVTLAFYKTLASKVLKDVAEKNLNVLKDHLKEIKLFKQSGMATNYDVLRVEVQVSNAETDLLNAIDNIAISEQNLAEILGQEKTDQTLTEVLPELHEALVDNVSNNEIYSRSDISAIKYKVSSLAFTEKAQSSYWVPRLALIGQYQYYNNLNDSFTDTNKYRSAYQVGLQLNWNIFDGMVSFSKSRQTTEQLVQAEKSYRILELKAQKDFEIGKRKYHYYLNLFKARNNDITKSKESVRLAKEGRRVGSRTNTDLLDAESDLYKSEAGAVNAQLGAIEALVNLQLAVGKKI